MLRWAGAEDRRMRAMLALFLMVMPGCDDTLFGVPIGGGDGPVEPVYEVGYAGVQEMWSDHCQACHPAVNPFVLDDLVADIQAGDERYIVAGDPGASMFWRLISGTRVEGDPRTMPDGSPVGLRAPDREHVRLWILEGAPISRGDGGEE
jgi:hypothetical protein